MGNPRKRRSHRRSHRRASRRGRRHSLFSNPIGGSLSAVSAPVKEMISKDFLMEASSVAAGFVLPGIVTNKFVPATWRNTPMKGYAVNIGTVAVVAALASFVNKRASKAILLGGGVKVILDLYTDFVAPMLGSVVSAAPATPALPAPAGGTATYFGDRGMGTFYGDNGLGSFDGASIGAAFGSATGMGDAYA